MEHTLYRPRQTRLEAIIIRFSQSMVRRSSLWTGDAEVAQVFGALVASEVQIRPGRGSFQHNLTVWRHVFLRYQPSHNPSTITRIC